MQRSRRTEETRSVKSLRQKRRTYLKAHVTIAASLCVGKEAQDGVRKGPGNQITQGCSDGKDSTVYSQSEKKLLEGLKPGSGMISFAFFSRSIWLLDEE